MQDTYRERFGMEKFIFEENILCKVKSNSIISSFVYRVCLKYENIFYKDTG